MFINYRDLDYIVIHHDGKKYIGEYRTSNFMAIENGNNDLVFKILSIKDKYEFIRNVVGYTPNEGSFPYLRTMEDFIKVLDALNKEYDRHFGNEITLKSSYFFVGEKVLVRNDLEIGKKYGILTAIEGHISLSNRVVTIYKIDYDDDTLKIEEDVHDLWWSTEMFIKLPSLTDTNMISPIVTSSKNVSFKAEESKNSTISINDFIKSKKHYQLNFNN